MRISKTINLSGTTNVHIRAKPRKYITLTAPVAVQKTVVVPSVVPNVPLQGTRKIIKQKAGCGCGRR